MTTAKVAVLGATGAIGQRFVRLLETHPWFRLTEVVASPRHAGEAYGDAVRWMDGALAPSAANLVLREVNDDLDADLCFSALPGGEAGPIERALAARGYRVFTNARDLRLEPDVPLVIPEVNPDHLALLERQRHGPDGGFVVANGNCTAIILALTLKPLADAFGVRDCHVVSLQALSGAGYPGVPSLDVTDNVLPFIPGEEGKVESEVPKILGTVREGSVSSSSLRVSATCTRVPVLEGHTLAVSVRLGDHAEPDRIHDAIRDFAGDPQRLRLPSAPALPLQVREEDDRPQPRRDRDAGGGMTVSVGRLRSDPILGWKFLAVGSNTVRGAAGASLLNAELAAAYGLLR